MRRVILLLVLAVVGAGWYGLTSSPAALVVDGSSLSPGVLRAELTAFNSHPGLYCYVSSLVNAAILKPGAGRDSVTASTEVQWINLRVEGIAIDKYVAADLHYVPSAADLTRAQVALEGELTQAAAHASQNCPGTAAQAVAAMPAEMRRAQVRDQASSAYLLSKLNATIPLTPTTIRAYYRAHLASYENLCVAIAIVPQSQLGAFAKAQSAGLSVAALAKKFSADRTSAAKGGFYGCVAPTSSSYTSVRNDIGATAIGRFSTTALSYTPNQGGPTYGLFVAPLSKRPVSLTQAQGLVISDIQTSNASAANSVKANILFAAAVTVDPAFGRWGLSSSGPSVFAPALPGDSGPATSTQLTAPSATPYQ